MLGAENAEQQSKAASRQYVMRGKASIEGMSDDERLFSPTAYGLGVPRLKCGPARNLLAVLRYKKARDKHQEIGS